MQAIWVASSASLPPEGQLVEFILDDRSIPIGGTYTGNGFRSRWTQYEVGRVRTWRTSAQSSVLPVRALHG